MGQTAIVSPQIIDSTSIGRDLITAADQAAAQAIIGVTGVDTSADYTWTGDHTFDGSATFTSVFDAVDGDFSGDVAVDGYITGGASGHAISLASTLLAESQLRTSTGGGTVFAWGWSGSQAYSYFTTTLFPSIDNNKDLGMTTNRWRTAYLYDGSFSGSLVSEVGGSYKLYNLGAEGDTDSEALVISADGTTYDISSTTTGTGSHRRIDIGGFIGTAFRGIRLDTTNGILDWQYNNATKFRVDLNTCKISTQGTVINDLRPNVSGASYNGTSTYRWSNVASVDGDFSGDVVMAANVDFTGLPTADPAVAGRLWNDSGTLKISAG